MKFTENLVKAKLVRRYKRFLADVELPSGEIAVAHCANSGAMTGCAEPGSDVYLLPNRNPKAKLDWRWELVDVGTSLVGIHSSRANALVEEAILAGQIPELGGYDTLRSEVKYGQNSRIDILLVKDGNQTDASCYVEIKSVTLRVGIEAHFPDAVTKRGTKHLHELSDMVAAGHRAVMLYLVQRSDCRVFRPAVDIDPVYTATLNAAMKKGVEAYAYSCHMSEQEIRVNKAIPIVPIE